MALFRNDLPLLLVVLGVGVGLLCVALTAFARQRKGGTTRMSVLWLAGLGGFAVITAAALLELSEWKSLSRSFWLVLWLTVGIAGLLLIAWGRLAWALLGEPRHGPLCPKCDYHIGERGALTSCSECGTDVSAMPASRLFRPKVRRWAVWSGTLLLACAIITPLTSLMLRDGLYSMLPTRILWSIAVSGANADRAIAELSKRQSTLSKYDPSLTRQMMVAAAEDYERSGGPVSGVNWWRGYTLSQPAMDEETRQLIASWLASGSRGQQYTAALICYYARPDAHFRITHLPKVLRSPDNAMTRLALQSLTFDKAWSIETFLAHINDPSTPVDIPTWDACLANYGNEGLQARLNLASGGDQGAVAASTSLFVEAMNALRDRNDAEPMINLAGSGAPLPAAGSISVGTQASHQHEGSIRATLLAVMQGARDPSDDAKATPLIPPGPAADWIENGVVSLSVNGFAARYYKVHALTVIDAMLADEQLAPHHVRLRKLRDRIDRPGP